jgi:hypothetical protein
MKTPIKAVLFLILGIVVAYLLISLLLSTVVFIVKLIAVLAVLAIAALVIRTVTSRTKGNGI